MKDDDESPRSRAHCIGRHLCYGLLLAVVLALLVVGCMTLPPA